MNEENMEEQEHDFPDILEAENDTLLRKWSIGFSNMKDASLF